MKFTSLALVGILIFTTPANADGFDLQIDGAARLSPSFNSTALSLNGLQAAEKFSISLDFRSSEATTIQQLSNLERAEYTPLRAVVTLGPIATPSIGGGACNLTMTRNMSSTFSNFLAIDCNLINLPSITIGTWARLEFLIAYPPETFGSVKEIANRSIFENQALYQLQNRGGIATGYTLKVSGSPANGTTTDVSDVTSTYRSK